MQAKSESLTKVINAGFDICGVGDLYFAYDREKKEYFLIHDDMNVMFKIIDREAMKILNNLSMKKNLEQGKIDLPNLLS